MKDKQKKVAEKKKAVLKSGIVDWWLLLAIHTATFTTSYAMQSFIVRQRLYEKHQLQIWLYIYMFESAIFFREVPFICLQNT